MGGSWLDCRLPPLTLVVSRLALRASMRLIARLGLERGTSSVSVSMLGRTCGDSPLTCTLGRREDAAAADLSATGLARFTLVPHSSMQSSVRLRQILSALRRTWRSGTRGPESIALAECRVPCGPALPANSAKPSASDAVASSTRYTEGATFCLAFAKASLSKGWTL